MILLENLYYYKELVLSSLNRGVNNPRTEGRGPCYSFLVQPHFVSRDMKAVKNQAQSGILGKLQQVIPVRDFEIQYVQGSYKHRTTNVSAQSLRKSRVLDIDV